MHGSVSAHAVYVMCTRIRAYNYAAPRRCEFPTPASRPRNCYYKTEARSHTVTALMT